MPDDIAQGEEEIQPRKLGRLTLISELGHGGMGTVHRAYDPKLGRQVAVKVLLDGREQTPEARARLDNEAQMLAKLSHRNIVTVFDAGVDEGQVWLSMEIVEGETIAQWCRKTRPWRDVLAAFKQAAQGIAAAHAENLVHLDIKPSNIMIGPDKHVRVMDFGLAQGLLSQIEDDATLDDPFEMDSSLESVTELGTRRGTPAYMSREQLLGLPTDARSDQFSLCVSMWECLTGRRPYEGHTVADLILALERGSLTPPEPGRRVPRWLLRVLERGLAQAPESRYPSIDELIAALENDPTRRRVGVGVTLGLTLCVGVIVGQRHVSLTRATRACEAEAAVIDDIWNDDARERVHAGLLASEARFADDTYANALPVIDAYVEEWRQARRDVCVRETIDDTLSVKLAAKSRECLDGRKYLMDGLFDIYANLEPSGRDRSVVQGMPTVVAQLTPIADCSDEQHLNSKPFLEADDEVLEQAATVNRLMAQTMAYLRTGFLDDGLATAREANRLAHLVEWPPLEASTDALVGIAYYNLNDFTKAEMHLENAFFLAGEAGDQETAFQASVTLISVVAIERARTQEAFRWGKIAQMLLRRVKASEVDDPRWSSYYGQLARLHASELSDYGAALDLYQKAYAVDVAAFGADHPYVANDMGNIGYALAMMGDIPQAEEAFQHSLEARRTAFGPDHPDLVNPMLNLSEAKISQGQYEEGLELAQEALRIAEGAFGPEHQTVGWALELVADVHERYGQYERALKLAERALHINEKVYGPVNTLTNSARRRIGRLRWAQGEYSDAIEHLERAIENESNQDHPQVGLMKRDLARVYVEVGDYNRARELINEAITTIAKSGDEFAALAGPRGEMARLEALQGDLKRARELAEDAIEFAGGVDKFDTEVAWALLIRAEIEAAAGDCKGAETSARRALNIEKSLGGDKHPNVTAALIRLGACAAERDAHDEAAKAYERALAGLKDAEQNPRNTTSRAFAEFGLARVRTGGADLDRAIQLATSARALLESVNWPHGTQEIDEWLAEHGLPQPS